jgi:hypothetical protein
MLSLRQGLHGHGFFLGAMVAPASWCPALYAGFAAAALLLHPAPSGTLDIFVCTRWGAVLPCCMCALAECDAVVEQLHLE